MKIQRLRKLLAIILVVAIMTSFAVPAMAATPDSEYSEQIHVYGYQHNDECGEETDAQICDLYEGEEVESEVNDYNAEPIDEICDELECVCEYRDCVYGELRVVDAPMAIASPNGFVPEFYAGSQSVLQNYINNAVSTRYPYIDIVIGLTNGFYVDFDSINIPADPADPDRNIVLMAYDNNDVRLRSHRRHFIVDGVLTLTDGVILEPRFPFGSGAVTGGVQLNSGSVLNMYGGEITGNTSHTNGGGVFVGSGAEFNMRGGEITGNRARHANHGGGGVFVDSGGTFTMVGGTISGNEAFGSGSGMNPVLTNGGGVYVNSGGTFTMEGGIISNNEVRIGHAGGVMVRSGATFSMSGGEISGNRAIGSQGGGVQVDGTFNMSGGTISRNHAIAGGGVLVVNGGVFTMHDGTISHNTGGLGAGVSVGRLVVSGEFTMYGGEISYNRATSRGGGVHVTGSSSTFTMNGGTISHNEVEAVGDIDVRGTVYGGGVDLSISSTFIMNYGTISSNTATDRGGGVNVQHGSTFNMISGTIRYNEAVNGGGVHADTDRWISSFGNFVIGTMEGGEITGNTATNGGGMHLNRGVFKMIGGIISDNEAEYGGGVWIGPHNVNQTMDTRFVLQSGEISDNTADNCGGGVFLNAIMRITYYYTHTYCERCDECIDYGYCGLCYDCRDNHIGYCGDYYEWICPDLCDYCSYYGVHDSERHEIFDAMGEFVMTGGSIVNNEAISGNGGGIFTTHYTYVYPYLPDSDVPHYLGLTIYPTAVFNGNTAGRGNFYPPRNAAAATNIAVTAERSSGFGHALNNDDINFAPPHPIVTFMGNGGMVHDAISHSFMVPIRTAIPPNQIPAPPDVVRNNHTFLGWSETAAAGSPLVTEWTSVVYQNKTFFAQWELIPTVTFMGNGGTVYGVVSHSFTVPNGAVLSSGQIPAIPNVVRSNHTFLGWSENAAAGSALVTDWTFEITQNRVFYAQWQWTPTGGGNGGGGTPPPIVELPEEEVPLAEWDGIHHAFLIGFADGTVRPRAEATRAQVATILFRLMSDTSRATHWRQDNPFPDVVITNWHNNAVSTAVNAGIFLGMPDGTFMPDRSITRAELAATIVRFMGVTAHNGAPMFNDIAGHWAQGYINAAAHNGWVMGDAGLGGQFRPNDTITRAELAAIVNRAFERLPEGPEDLLPGMRVWPDNANPSAWYYLYIQEATNSHYYMMKDDGIHETWVEMLAQERPWALLERPNSQPGDIFVGAAPLPASVPAAATDDVVDDYYADDYDEDADVA